MHGAFRRACRDGRACGGVGRARSDALLDEIPGSGGHESHAEAEEGVEGGGRVAAAVPAKDELVEVSLQVLAAQAVEGSQRPSLEIGKDAVGPLQHDMGGHGSDDFRVVDVTGQAGVPGPAVGDDAGAGRCDANT